MQTKKQRFAEEQVLHLAKLARLTLTDEEINRFQAQLSSILEYFEKLKELETSGVKETSQVTGLLNVIRADQADEACHLQRGGYYKTKAIFEEVSPTQK